MYLHTRATRRHVSQHLIIKRHVNLMWPYYRYNNVSSLKNIHVSVYVGETVGFALGSCHKPVFSIVVSSYENECFCSLEELLSRRRTFNDWYD